MENCQPNAFATTRTHVNASGTATINLSRNLNYKDSIRVMAHELAYVKTREMLISPNTAITPGSL